jgi:hypothetical protein
LLPSICLSVHLSVCPFISTYYQSVRLSFFHPIQLNNKHRLLSFPFPLSLCLWSTPTRLPLPLFYHPTALSFLLISCPCYCALCTSTSLIVIFIFIISLPLPLFICIFLSLFFPYCLSICILSLFRLSSVLHTLSLSHPLIEVLHSRTIVEMNIITQKLNPSGRSLVCAIFSIILSNQLIKISFD